MVWSDSMRDDPEMRMWMRSVDLEQPMTPVLFDMLELMSAQEIHRLGVQGHRAELMEETEDSDFFYD